MGNYNINDEDDDYDDVVNKVPYDSEPISRKPIIQQSQQNQNSYYKPTKKWPMVIISLVCIALIVSTVIMYGQFKNLKSIKPNYQINVNTSTSISAEAKNYNSCKALLASVCVTASTSASTVTDYNSFFSGTGLASVSRGSGLIFNLQQNADNLTSSCYILTNFHVISGDSEAPLGNYWILPCDGDQPISATLVGGSRVYDVAVLKVSDSLELYKSSCQNFEMLDINNNMYWGMETIAVGNSLAGGLSITDGVIAQEETYFRTTVGSESFYEVYIKFTNGVNSGNSGGGLFDVATGKLIGIVSLKSADLQNETVQATNFAIPINVAMAIAENVISSNNTSKISSGLSYKCLQVGSLNLKNYVDYGCANPQIQFDEHGGKLTYDSIIASTSLGSGGVLVKGAVIQKVYKYTINGVETVVNQDINRCCTLDGYVFKLLKGDSITLIINGKEKTFVVTSQDYIV